MHVRLIDANSLGYAQHHANDISLAGSLQTQAVSGVMRHLRRNLQFDKQVFNVLIWDGRAQWRYDLHPGYKAGRHRTPEQRESRRAYEAQQPWIRRVLRSFPVAQVQHPHAEADDLAFGLSRALARQGHLVSLFTADTDWLQLVSSRVQWVNARKPSQVVMADGFVRSSGGFATPADVAAVKALMGDTSDDIDGLPDVGPKRAQGLLAKYGGLQEVLAAAQDFLTFSAEPKYFHSLMVPEYRDLVERNSRLVDLSRGPRLAADDVALSFGQFDELDLYEALVDLDFKTMQDEFASWQRALDVEVDRANALSVKRALETLGSSWDA